MVVTNFGQAGDELIEAYLNQSVESGEGTWYRHDKRFEVSPAATQVIRIEDLEPGADYTLAVRYKRGLLPTPSHASANPQKWPSQSRGIFLTSIDPPTILSGVWERVDASNEKITLTIRPAVGQENQDIDVYLGYSTLIGTIAGPHVGDVTFVHNNMFGDTAYADELAMEDVMTYTVLTVGESAIESIQSDPLEVWPGPAGIPTFLWELSRGSGYEVGADSEVQPTWNIEVWDNYDNAGGTQVAEWRMDILVLAGSNQNDTGELTGITSELSIDLQLRYRRTQFGVDDFGRLGTGPYIHSVLISNVTYDN